jgi:hypothetical protein
MPAVVDLDSLKADVVGVLEHRDRAAAVESDIELARQAVKRSVIEDVEVPFAGKGAGVDQLLRIDARRRRAGDVADIVGARAARAEPEILNGLDRRNGIGGRDLADLDIGAGRHMRIAAAIFLGEVGET